MQELKAKLEALADRVKIKMQNCKRIDEEGIREYEKRVCKEWMW